MATHTKICRRQRIVRRRVQHRWVSLMLLLLLLQLIQYRAHTAVFSSVPASASVPGPRAKHRNNSAQCLGVWRCCRCCCCCGNGADRSIASSPPPTCTYGSIISDICGINSFFCCVRYILVAALSTSIGSGTAVGAAARSGGATAAPLNGRT
jgi:hypothetical protein